MTEHWSEAENIRREGGRVHFRPGPAAVWCDVWGRGRGLLKCWWYQGSWWRVSEGAFWSSHRQDTRLSEPITNSEWTEISRFDIDVYFSVVTRWGWEYDTWHMFRSELSQRDVIIIPVVLRWPAMCDMIIYILTTNCSCRLQAVQRQVKSEKLVFDKVV